LTNKAKYGKRTDKKSRGFDCGHFIVFYGLAGSFLMKWSHFGHKILTEKREEGKTMTDDELKTKAQKIRVKKEALILQTEDIGQDRKELREEGGSTSLAPLKTEYQKRLQKGMTEELKISLKGK
jgi:hypothetical protein